MDDPNTAPSPVEPTPDVYQAPQVERVLTADDLAREIQYAGGISIPG
ncbi:MAG: hypothetical protein ABL961_01460 [Vicinamibacterales bacterium]